MRISCIIPTIAIFAFCTHAETIAQINGIRYQSPFNHKNVTNVQGLVTAKGREGFYMRSPSPDNDSRTSESIYVHGSYSRNNSNVQVGNIISLDGRVVEYKGQPEFLSLTEIDRARKIRVLAKNRVVAPVLLGQNGLRPPTEQYTSLDHGDVFGLPNNRSSLSRTNPSLEPTKYGLDFWESLSGELVTVRLPRAVSKPNKFGDTWVVGDWRTSGADDRGGLTVRPLDANPEAILIGNPLDGSENPKTTKLGDTLEDITGIVTYEFGYYRILPTSGIRITTSRQPAEPPPTNLVSKGDCSGITVGQYNVENLNPKSPNLKAIAAQIVDYLKTPDLLFVQEVQDNDGPVDDGTVAANSTLAALTQAIHNHQNDPGFTYEFVDIDPSDNRDGGQPGGNIRVAYLYNPRVLRLYKLRPGGALDANSILKGPELKFNPGRIDPRNRIWYNTRKPLAAAWQMVDTNDTFFTVNVHFTSKQGSTSLHGDARPPINGGVSQRDAQARVTGDFVAQILHQDRRAAVIVAGDFNEFAFVTPLQKTFVQTSGLKALDAVVGLSEVERYTYVHEMNAQQLDHFFVSEKVASREPLMQHVHVSSWASVEDEVSDHDPSVARVNVCA